eukprot:GHVU01096885.1.p1 GENE.GHVU01096885.1~~GHVU01096885.1.p1  ORF type:complete len:104 (+),score=0.99 GHVU01096885.1:308-619(+)
MLTTRTIKSVKLIVHLWLLFDPTDPFITGETGIRSGDTTRQHLQGRPSHYTTSPEPTNAFTRRIDLTLNPAIDLDLSCSLGIVPADKSPYQAVTIHIEDIGPR